MRRVLALSVMAASAMMGSAGNADASPVRSTFEAVDLACSALTSAGGTAFLGVTTRPDGGAFTTVWRAGEDPATSDPWLSGSTAEAELAGSALTATIPLVDIETGADHGAAVVQAVVTPSGPGTTSTTATREGNVGHRVTMTITPGEATGSLTVPGVGQFQLAGCVVELVSVDSFATNPAAFVDNLSTHVVVECTFEDPDGDVHLFVEGFVDSVPDQLDASMWEDQDGAEEPVQGGSGVATLTRSSLSATIGLTEASGTPLGTATVDALLAVVDRNRMTTVNGPFTSTVRVEQLALEGLLSLPDGRSFSLDGCTALREQGQERVHP